MPAPKTITEADLKTYAHAELGDFADMLGFTVEGGSYDSVVNSALADYGVSEPSGIEGVLPVALILACTRYTLWRHITNVTNAKFNLADSGTNLSLSQMNDHARASMLTAKSERDDLRVQVAYEAGSSSAVLMYEVTRPDDPYVDTQDVSDEFS